MCRLQWSEWDVSKLGNYFILIIIIIIIIIV